MPFCTHGSIQKPYVYILALSMVLKALQNEGQTFYNSQPGLGIALPPGVMWGWHVMDGVQLVLKGLIPSADIKCPK